MSLRRYVTFTGLIVSLAALAFSLGSWSAQRAISQQLAHNDARLTALQGDVAKSILAIRQSSPTAAGTDGHRLPDVVTAAGSPQSAFVDEIKRQIQSEMGLFSVRLLRDRRESFVELNAKDSLGKTSYGTAGYLGNGYFITVKHGVIALDEPLDGRDARKISSVTIRYKGKDIPARIIDSGNATTEVHPGDWAIIKVRQELDLPALNINTSYAYDFAEPIVRLGNDYSKGISVSTGYIGQQTANGLVTALTDGHPGVSGGGVLNQRGDLVGIPIGRMQGDYRFSFILPLREEMFRRIPAAAPAEHTVAAGE
jgi:S1-C subfamily serine protease